ncbi:MAG: tetratricopeptide repeat protein [bacterium]|jgi:predicted ATPase/DNA-binding XRE family transcriptional regulator|nr:tetratricopeptide repeat protein [bacterium]
MVQPAAFGDLLRQHRLAAALTQEQLAERADLSPRAVAYLEAGSRRPYASTVTRLTAALELDAARSAALRRAAHGLHFGLARPYQIFAPLSPLLGRDHEEAVAVDLLRRPDVRLLTLTGAGGVGKTRLAQRVADHLRPEMADGAAAVALDSLREPDLVGATIVSALGIGAEPGRPPLRTLADHLASRELVLLLDNFEHVREAGPQVVELLAACPGLKILATSRAPLRVEGEHELEVLPLAVQDGVRLFGDRARAVRAGFGGDLEVVAEICRQLDGLPLAIELAAARTRAMTVEQIAARMQRSFRLLAGGSQTAPARQQTLRATLDWSYDLLAEPERGLFRLLGVFAGGWTLEAAEAVSRSGDTLELLARLTEQSLIACDPRGPTMRYRFLEPVRRYALERLAAGGEEPEASRAHAEYFLGLAEQADLRGPDQGAWLDRLEQEHANLRAALRWLRVRGAAWQGLRLSTALWEFCWRRSHLAEGCAELRAMLDQAGSAPPAALRARGLEALGQLAFRQGDRDEAREALQAAVEAAHASGEPLSLAQAQRSLGRLALEEGCHAEARQLLEDCLRIERERRYPTGLSMTLKYLGWLALLESDHTRAEALIEEGLARAAEIEDRAGIGAGHFLLAHVQLDRGNAVAAASQAARSLRIFADVGFDYGIAYALEALADAEAVLDRRERTLMLSGAAAAVREASGARAAAELEDRHNRSLEAAREALGGEADALFAHGLVLPSEAAVALALEGV